jgi:catechol 2,3-dioxygenase-like lactoylglutathione lyase family enzyme
LGFANTVLEIRQEKVERARIVGLVITGDTPSNKPVVVNNARQLDLSISNGCATDDFRREHPEAQCLNLKVDHLVLRTADAQACIDLFSVGLGIRLALDKKAPQWGGRMLFFRAGELTLEVIEPITDKPERDYFWGLAYQCPELSAMAASLTNSGVALSDIRDGRKPGTRVASVKSHTLGIPTLLIEPSSSV